MRADAERIAGSSVRRVGPKPCSAKQDRRVDCTQLGGLGLRGAATTAAQRARTRGFATPAFAGCALWLVTETRTSVPIGDWSVKQRIVSAQSRRYPLGLTRGPIRNSRDRQRRSFASL